MYLFVYAFFIHNGFEIHLCCCVCVCVSNFIHFLLLCTILMYESVMTFLSVFLLVVIRIVSCLAFCE